MTGISWCLATPEFSQYFSYILYINTLRKSEGLLSEHSRSITMGRKMRCKDKVQFLRELGTQHNYIYKTVVKQEI